MMMNKKINCGMCCGNCEGTCCCGSCGNGKEKCAHCGSCGMPEANPQNDYEDLKASLRAALEAVIQMMIDAIEEDLEEEYAVLVLDETGDDEVLGRSECEAFFEGRYCFDDQAIEDDFGLIVAYDSTRLIEIGGEYYLIDAPLMILEIDENGNSCSVSAETIMTSRRFLKENMVKLTLDGETYAAYRLAI